MSAQQTPLLNYEFNDGISKITLDDGKANVMSVQMQAQINEALDKAEADGGVVVITGRAGILSGGFDLGTFKRGDVEECMQMLVGGAELSYRFLSFPTPVIVACTGHAIAMGAFMLLSTDYRIAADGDAKFAANEVAIGMTVPYFAIEVCRQRIDPRALSRAVDLAQVFDVNTGLQAGFIDEVCSPENLMKTAMDKASEFMNLNLSSHKETKLRLREHLLKDLRTAIERDAHHWAQSYSH